jgi:hypothetical protein
MAANKIPANDNAAAPLVACSLTAGDLAAQARRWVRLAARAMTGRAETAHGLRISFHPEPGAEEELRALAAAENECCPWAAWTVEASAGRLVLDVRSAGGGVTALHGMLTGLAPAPASRSHADP